MYISIKGLNIEFKTKAVKVTNKPIKISTLESRINFVRFNFTTSNINCSISINSLKLSKRIFKRQIIKNVKDFLK